MAIYFDYWPMIRLLLFDLGETLIHCGVPFPHVLDALAETASDEQLARIESQFAEILDNAGISQFFAPFEAKVTISARAGAFKSGSTHFCCGGAAVWHRDDACRMSVYYRKPCASDRRSQSGTEDPRLWRSPDGSVFARWLEASGVIAELVAPQDIQNRERAIAVVLKETRNITGFKCLTHNRTIFQGQDTPSAVATSGTRESLSKSRCISPFAVLNVGRSRT